MKKSIFKNGEVASNVTLSRAEMKNIKGGVQHACIVTCIMDSVNGPQNGYQQVQDCTHDQSAVCTSVGQIYVSCVCH